MFTTAALFLITLAASIIFYQRIKMAQSEYEESKQSVRNITFGFTRQAKRIETDIARLEKETMEAKILAVKAMQTEHQKDGKNSADLKVVEELSDRVETIEKSIEGIRKEVQEIAKLPRTIVQPVPVDAPIPVQGENIYNQLTETEIEVLRMIVDIGEGSVPEIRDQIGKTREHTARLLKKLYDKGFIDRNTSRMPYRYVIRKEIKDLILQGSETSTLSR